MLDVPQDRARPARRYHGDQVAPHVAGWAAPPLLMTTATFFLRNLVRAFLAGSWSFDELLQRGGEACGRRPPWLRPLVREVLAAFPDPQALPEEDRLSTYLHQYSQRKPALARQEPGRIFWVTPRMSPATGIPAADLPPLTTGTEVAHWLGLEPALLDWFAPPSWRARTAGEKGGHYTYRWLHKRTGQVRLVEAPKRRLKTIQRQVLRQVLDQVSPHEAAHGFRSARSVLTYAAPHVGRRVVLRFDLRNFFPSIPASRVHAFFRRVGYPREVARILARLCTTVTPAAVWNAVQEGTPPAAERQSFEQAHLPQGAPTSPALANLCAFRLDRRLAGLARVLGACYTRYADDLAFSGGPLLERNARRLHVLVCRIALEEGFEINTRKTRLMRHGVRQQLAGVVVNVRPNVRRADYDRLKAVLHNCVRHGPAGQDRDGHIDFRAHLLGRIAHVKRIHPGRGRRLMEMFERIEW